jgi:hypothetical protein
MDVIAQPKSIHREQWHSRGIQRSSFSGTLPWFGGAVIDGDLRQTGQSSVELFADMIGSQAQL